MVLSLNIISIINLLLLSALFFWKRGNNKENILLSIILVAPVFCQAYNMSVHEGLFQHYKYLLLLAIPTSCLWSPSIFFYALFSIQKRKNFHSIDILHLIPFFLGLACTLWLLFVPSQHSINNRTSVETPSILAIIDLILITQMFIYLIISWLVVARYNRKLKHLFSDIERLSAKWIQEFIVVFIISYLIVFVPFLVGSVDNALYIYFPLCTSLCYLFVVYKSITSPMIFNPKEQDVLLTIEDEIVLQTDKELIVQSSSNLHLIDNCASILNHYMEQEKPYLNTELNIKMLSEQLDVTVHCLSETINKKFNKNFFDFINQYRVEEARILLMESDLQKYTIDSICNLCGFGSRSSFYTAFKKITGTSPGEYQKQNCN